MVMQKFGKWAVEFLKREDGPTAVEYAVMLALIIAVCIAAITALGTNTNKTFTSVGDVIDEALERAGG
jgi:pilus assembly protein Flp/PilA